ncbi:MULTISPECIES: hypothetical protein [Gammaproteobacteria]|jgi:hypothetical protein|uniref:hypothetical protein n=1 Tax=Gammaproteobacteria TaxID=1236 RepID=UPI00157B9651|nr:MULTISPECIES: hypothetical protein [Gammaproteobacteria]MDP8628064.1 hypothetical protein [Serratia marcescens]MDP8677482.1 hypothetical protein [Serratia marcescens]MDP8692491.1 hypothetical protein [Serratia marcescens]MDP8702150.1 hypothetical protein [Serratia marcescens]MDP8711932.1 hypothetical protein [Serratia marcescens]
MEPERFKRTMKARGHWQDGELTSAEPAVLVDDRGSVTLNEPAKGYWVDGAPVWPAYNPVTGEDLSDQLREVLEANHKKAIILTLADAAATLKDMAKELAVERLFIRPTTWQNSLVIME